mgnify:CR=1 FL=1
MTKFVSPKIKMKSGARLAAVQANYMIAFGGLPVDEVIEDFVSGKVGRVAIDNQAKKKIWKNHLICFCTANGVMRK